LNDPEDDLEDEEEESDLKKLPPMTPPEEAETRLRFHVNTSSDKAMILVTCFLEKPILRIDQFSNSG